MLELKNITKKFPGVLALDNVNLEFMKGEIHALLGENGAGKSTAMNIITGNYQPDSGDIILNGELVKIKDYQDAQNRRISIVNQEIQIVADSSVAENIMLDKLHQYTKKGMINWTKLKNEALSYIQMVGLNVSISEPIYKLSAAQKQLCQIAKAISSKAEFLLLDEPTSSLTQYEASVLFDLLRKFKSQGVGIIFVSHKIEEVLAICDKVSVLRDGKYIGTKPCAGLGKQDIVEMMIGRKTDDVWLGKLKRKTNETVLNVKDLCQKNTFSNINLHLKKGEILGFYGLVGSGRTELAKIIIGEDSYSSGTIEINGLKTKIRGISDSFSKYGLGYVTENRKEEGLILDFDIRDNTTIVVWKRIKNFIRFLSPKKINELTEQMVKDLSIKASSIYQKVQNLSGGNQQKVCISKWLAADCDILIIDEPTIGVDVGAKQQIHELIWRLANEEQKSIVLISSDMPEMIKLARRILVFKEKQIAGEIDDIDHNVGSYDEISKKIGMLLS